MGLQWQLGVRAQGCSRKHHGFPSPLLILIRPPKQDPTPSPLSRPAPVHPSHPLSPILPLPIPLATKPDSSRRRTWQQCRERLIARKEGGAWRGAGGGRDVSGRALARLGDHTKGGGSSALQCRGDGQPGSRPPCPEIQPRVPDLIPQTPSSCPLGQSHADLSLLESPGVPGAAAP